MKKQKQSKDFKIQMTNVNKFNKKFNPMHMSPQHPMEKVLDLKMSQNKMMVEFLFLLFLLYVQYRLVPEWKHQMLMSGAGGASPSSPTMDVDSSGHAASKHKAETQGGAAAKAVKFDSDQFQSQRSKRQRWTLDVLVKWRSHTMM